MTRRRNRYYVVLHELPNGMLLDTLAFTNDKQAGAWVVMMRKREPTHTFSDPTLVTTLPRPRK